MSSGKRSNYKVVCHWYQNKASEMHQIKIIMNYPKKIIKMSHTSHVMESPFSDFLKGF